MPRSFSSTAHVLTRASYPLPTDNFTVGIRFYQNGSWYDSQKVLFIIASDGTHTFQILKWTPGNQFYVGWLNGGSDSRISWGGENFADAWNTLICSFDSSRTGAKSQVWSPAGTYRSDANLYSLDLSAQTLQIGNYATSYNMDGLMGEVAVWGRAFSQNTTLGYCPEVRAAQGGIPFYRVDPSNLLDYWPLLGNDSPEPNWAAANPGRSLTVTGAGKGSQDAPLGLWNFQHQLVGQYIQAVEGRPDFMPVFSRILTMQGINQ